jgi:hypothetical protein
MAGNTPQYRPYFAAQRPGKTERRRKLPANTQTRAEFIDFYRIPAEGLCNPSSVEIFRMIERISIEFVGLGLLARNCPNGR